MFGSNVSSTYVPSTNVKAIDNASRVFSQKRVESLRL
jgi:hypothetical protein